MTHRQRSVQALANELASIEASLTEEQKTLLGRKVVGSLKAELHAASAEQTAILFRAQLANKNTTVSRFRCAASLDLSRQAVAAIEAARAPEQQLQHALQGLLEAAKRYASMESIYAELAKDGRNASALDLLREGNSPERLAFEAEEVQALLVRDRTTSPLGDERKKVGDAAHMLALALSSEREALDAMNAIRMSQDESERAVDDMAGGAVASSLDTAVARSDLPTSGGAYNNVTDPSAGSKTDSSLKLEHLLDMAAEGDYGAHLLSRLDPTPWVENGEIRIEEEEEAALGRGKDAPQHLPTEMNADGTPKGPLPGESGGVKNASASPVLTRAD